MTRTYSGCYQDQLMQMQPSKPDKGYMSSLNKAVILIVALVSIISCKPLIIHDEPPVEQATQYDPAKAQQAQRLDEEIHQLLGNWLLAQNTQNFPLYSSLYSPNFHGIRRSGAHQFDLDISGWLKDRRRMFTKPMSVEVEDIRLPSDLNLIRSNSIKVRFVQHYSQGKYQDLGYKELMLERQSEGRFLISYEEMTASEVAHEVNSQNSKYAIVKIATNRGKILPIDDRDWAAIKRESKDGVNVSVYVASGKFKWHGDESLFRDEATVFAQDYKGISISSNGSRLEFSKSANRISSMDDLVATMRTIRESLLAKYQHEMGNGAIPPDYTKIKNLAIFTHGMNFGIMLNPDHVSQNGHRIHLYYDGIHSIELGDQGQTRYRANISQFADATKNLLTDDPRFHLFACRTASPVYVKDSDPWNIEIRGGASSFASQLASTLKNAGLKDVSVYGHTTAGGATTNPYGRIYGLDAVVYGKDAQGLAKPGGEGLLLFDYFYDPGYITEYLSIYKSSAPAQEKRTLERLSRILKNQMWTQFANRVWSQSRLTGKKLGMDIFMNPSKARDALRLDWKNTFDPTILLPTNEGQRKSS